MKKTHLTLINFQNSQVTQIIIFIIYFYLIIGKLFLFLQFVILSNFILTNNIL